METKNITNKAVTQNCEKQHSVAGDVFQELYAVNLDKYTEEKSGLTYLPWADAMVEVKKRYPDMEYEITWFPDSERPEVTNPYLYRPGLGYMVFTKVTIEGKSAIMWLPVLDSNNKQMKNEPYTYDTKNRKGIVVNAATWYEINKAIMRCLVKNFGVFGLGIYIYKKDSLPEPESDAIDAENKAKKELAEAKRVLKETGNELIKNKSMDAKTLKEIVAKHNDGDSNTASIASVDVVNKIVEELKSSLKNP